MNSRQRIGQIVTLLVSALGAWVSITLMLIHGRTSAGDTAGAAKLCGDGAQFDCSVAAASQYSEIFGISIAAIGFAFYVAVILATALAGKEETKNGASTTSLLVFGGFSFAILYTIYLAYVNALVLPKSCDKCVYLYGVNVVGFLASARWATHDNNHPLPVLFKSPGKVLGDSKTLVFALTFAVALGGATYQLNKMKSAAGEAVATPSAAEVIDEAQRVDTTVLYREDAASFGPVDAPIHIVEFSDFECPYCARFAAVINQIKKDFPNEVRVTFRNYPLSFHPNARLVARGAVCANEQRNFWGFHDEAFGRQSSLSKPDFSVDDVVQIANDAGLNGEELRDCVLSSFSEARVARDIEDGKAVNLRGTPTVFINGVPYNGPLDIDGLSKVVRDVLQVLQAAE